MCVCVLLNSISTWRKHLNTARARAMFGSDWQCAIDKVDQSSLFRFGSAEKKHCVQSLPRPCGANSMGGLVKSVFGIGTKESECGESSLDIASLQHWP